jgi:diguanylate cyclase (GGDEF)-like protein
MTTQTEPLTCKPTKEDGFLWAVVILSVLTVALLIAYSLLYLTPAFTTLIAQDTEGTAILLGTHLKADLALGERPFAKETMPVGFEAEIAKTIQNLHLMKIKVFAPNGLVIYSTAAKDIGNINEHDYFQQVVAHGKPFTKIVQKDALSLEGQKVTVDVVETYVPAMATNGDFLGAFEIYLDITGPKARLDHLVAHSNHLLYAGSAMLLIVMLLIANRARANIVSRRQAETKIIQQAESLEATNNDLSIVNEISEVISHSIDLDRLLPGILDVIASRFAVFSQITRGGIFLVAGDKLILTAHLGHDDELLRLHKDITINDCLCGQAARTGEVIFSESSVHDANHTLCVNHSEPHGHVIIPLIAQAAVVGVLYLYTEEEVHVSDKQNLLQGLGRQIGLAISNVSLYQQTKKLAFYDPLTGLPNRRFMETRIDNLVLTAQRYGRSLSVAMVDIDFFKNYNDTMGHAAGDRILANVGALIRKEIREADFAARYGGEEFLLLLAETDQCGAFLGVERIRKTIEQKAGVTVSIGVTSYRLGMTVSQLLKEADDALYLAKTNGRNRVEWSDLSRKPCHEKSA